MNLKLCKRLRREAERETIGLPTREYFAKRGTIYLAVHSTRGYYRMLKKGVRE